MRTYFLDDMTAAYLQTAYFTDGYGDELEDPEFTLAFKSDAYSACCQFEDACQELSLNIRQEYDPAQLGHDLWLTRNGHGAGFWDKPAVYGDNAVMFTALARAQGAHDVEFAE